MICRHAKRLKNEHHLEINGVSENWLICKQCFDYFKTLSVVRVLQ